MKSLPMFVFLAGLSLALAVQAQTCTRSSGANTVALLELYTSEGCNSCPPADRFVGELVKHSDPDRLIPIALHVDYWDYIGWQDRFASPGYTQRQYWENEKSSGHRSAYTPEIFLSGKESRGWGSGDIQRQLAQVNALPAQAHLSLSIQPDHRFKVNASVQPGIAQDDIRIFVALTQNGLSSAVRAGENQGVTLHHDAVVRQWIGPLPLQSVVEPTPPNTGEGGALNIVAFAQNIRTGAVLQALSMPWACNKI